jgi:hypothetical protein
MQVGYLKQRIRQPERPENRAHLDVGKTHVLRDVALCLRNRDAINVLDDRDDNRKPDDGVADTRRFFAVITSDTRGDPVRGLSAHEG